MAESVESPCDFQWITKPTDGKFGVKGLALRRHSANCSSVRVRRSNYGIARFRQLNAFQIVRAFFSWQDGCDYGQCAFISKRFSGKSTRPDPRNQGTAPRMTRFDGEESPPFEIVEPAEWRVPIIFNSPHSGSVYPSEFLDASRIDLWTLRRSEDSFMDELIGGLSAAFPVVRVNFPRSYVDVNREPYELDPRMFTGRLPSFANTRSMRVAGGLGTIPRVVGDGQEIYRERLSVDEALSRIEAFYKPYHRALRRLIQKVHQTFGAAILVDCHSMPSIGVSRDEPRRPDIVIGDRYGTSCAPRLPDVVEQTMSRLGYSVARNKPYAGGFITEHYGNPASGLHTIQLELNRAVYMDERRREKGPRFPRVAADFTTLANALADLPLGELKPFRAAAE
jgi:N-formylglutamate amidohydrolase